MVYTYNCIYYTVTVYGACVGNADASPSVNSKATVRRKSLERTTVLALRHFLPSTFHGRVHSALLYPALWDQKKYCGGKSRVLSSAPYECRLFFRTNCKLFTLIQPP